MGRLIKTFSSTDMSDVGVFHQHVKKKNTPAQILNFGKYNIFDYQSSNDEYHSSCRQE